MTWYREGSRWIGVDSREKGVDSYHEIVGRREYIVKMR